MSIVNRFNVNNTPVTLNTGIYDVSSQNNGAVFESLSSLLNNVNLDTLIPLTVRKGGMSIKFIQGSIPSSDNKYVQYRLMDDEWSTNTEDWAIADEGVYVENPEFVYVKTDKDNKILLAIKTDGTIYFGAGVPQQVKDYIEEKISSLSLDEYEDIVAFLSDYLGSDTTLKAMIDGINDQIDTKVNKEEGKSLINADYAETKNVIDNPEFFEVTTDSENKVLEGIQKDGTKVIGGDLNVGGSTKILSEMEVAGVSYKVIENPEYLAAWLDAENKVIFGLKADGRTFVGDADFLDDLKRIKEFLPSLNTKIDWDALSRVVILDNPEFLNVEIDEDGKVLSSRNKEGIKKEHIGFETPKVSIAGHAVENIEDLEGRNEITTDSNGKIISYRDRDGVKHEEVGIKTNHLELSEDGMTEFQQALKEHGLSNTCNWSDYISNDGEIPLCLPEPKLATVNFVTPNGLPTAKNQDIQGYVEYSDMLGNYFKKKVILNGQGSSSIQYNNQKNIAVDLFDSEWDGDAFAIKIGNWVPQDSFHVKTFYMDPIRGLADVCYKYAEYVIQETNTRPNRLAREVDKVTVNGDTGVITNDYDTGALCHPDGFPCLVYSNGEFMGVYSWNLKKHRDNYMMDKKDYESIIIDPDACNLWNLNPINWANMEIRNPKTLICMDGSKYDGDAPLELIDSTSEYYDSTNKDHKNTVKTKNAIVDLHNAVSVIAEAMSIVTSNGTIKVGDYDGEYSSEINYTKGHWVKDSDSFYMSIHSTNQDNPVSDENYWANITQAISSIRTLFEQTFDVDGLILFWLLSQFMDNWDGLRDRNTQWLRYKKSGKWCPSFYDTDNCIGYCGFPWLENPHDSLVQSEYYGENLINSWLWQFYHDVIVTKYNELRQSGLISADAYMRSYNDWYSRIGTSYIKINADKWDVPCYRNGKTDTEHWKQIGIVRWGEVTYDENVDYAVGDEVNYGNGDYIRGSYVVKFRCIKACRGKTPCGLYPNKPQAGGVFDSPRRVKAWLDAKIEILNNLLK